MNRDAKNKKHINILRAKTVMPPMKINSMSTSVTRIVAAPTDAVPGC